jgi:hypothetical protein
VGDPPEGALIGVSRRIRRSRGGTFVLRIPAAELEILRTLPPQLRALLEEGDALEDPALRRLYPSAYPDDPDATAEFDGFVRDDLTAQRMAAIDTMANTIDSGRLNEDELGAWLGSINDLRLVLGVRLGVTEESDPEEFADGAERASSFALYTYLSYLEEEIVEALSQS